MIRAVFDTNVIVSSILAPGGLPERLVRAWVGGAFIMCASPDTLDEVIGVLRRPKVTRRAGVSSHGVESLILALKDAVFCVEPEVVERVVPGDPDDDLIIAAAVATRADYIVTGDRELLAIGEHRGVKIVSPREFAAVLKSSGLK